MNIFKLVRESALTKQKHKLASMGLGFASLFLSSSAFAATVNLPLTKFFCDIALALQSQWAPGIILIVLIIEGFLFMVVKKGVLSMLMVTVVAATIIFGAARLLNLIQPGAKCIGTAVSSLSVPHSTIG